MFIIDIMMAISNWLWGWPLLILTSAVAVYLSVRFKFFQFTRFGHAMKNTFGKIFDKGDGEGDISPFQACCTALASTLGVGNIAGVSVAIATGGPGAVFWMWAVALMGFIVKFSEITLGMAYRERDPETGRWHGGFYWYVRRGLGKSWKWLGIFWAVILGCAMVFAPAVQANSVVEAIRVSFDVPGWIVGVIFAVIMAVVLVGGGDGSMTVAYNTACTLLHHMHAVDIYPLVYSHATNVVPAVQDEKALEGINQIVSFFHR